MSKTTQIPQTVFTLDELVSYCGYKKNYIYQLIHKRKIPAHKPPLGRKLFFLKAEIDNWLLARKLETIEEIQKAITTKNLNQ
ncbi:MAG: helix-turn-helix domain-containing protein [Ferruginibacter sp.]